MKTGLGAVLGSGLAAWVLLMFAGCQVSVGEEVDGAGGTSNAATGGAASALVEDCTSDEPDTNDTRDAAWPLLDGSRVCLAADDRDWFYVDTPDDGKAHILELGLAPDPGADVRFRAEAASDGSTIGSDWTEESTDETAWLTLGPGVRTLIELSRYSVGGSVALTTRLQPEADPYSPNGSSDDAAEISVNEPITAEFHQPYSAATAQAYEDWYRVSLAVGPHKIAFSEVVTSQRVQVSVTNPRGEHVEGGAALNPGALLDLSFDAKLAGPYLISVSDFEAGPGSFSVGKKPAALSQSYTFEVIE